MINAAPYIRKAFYALLNNAIVYEGVTIPVYEGRIGDLVAGTAGSYKIEIAEQNSNEAHNKSSFNGEWTQVIEVITETTGSPVRKHADAIAGLITPLVTPTPKASGLTIAPPLQIVWVKLRTTGHLSEEGETTFVNRTILTYSLRIHQI
jgi:hypothetical protein